MLICPRKNFDTISADIYRFIKDSTKDIWDDCRRMLHGLTDRYELVHSLLDIQRGLISSSNSTSTNEASRLLLLLKMRMLLLLRRRWMANWNMAGCFSFCFYSFWYCHGEWWTIISQVKGLFLYLNRLV